MKYAPPQGWFGLRKPTPPYSALVAKDGSTVWAEDASGKTIASGEAGVDDASVIQKAIDVGDRIFIKAGVYYAELQMSKSNLIICGEGDATIIHGYLKNDGSFSDVSSDLTADATQFGHTVTVADGSKFSVGDMIYISASAGYSVNEITGIDGDNLTLAFPLQHTYTVSGGGKVTKVNAVRNSMFANVRIVWTDETRFRYANRCVMYNLTLDDNGGNGLKIYESMFCSVTACRVSGGTHGIVLPGSYGNVVNRCVAKNVTGDGGGIIINEGIYNIVSNNVVMRSKNGIRFWDGVYFSDIVSNTVESSEVGIKVDSAIKYITIVGNAVKGGYNGIFGDPQYAVISGNNVYYASDGGIKLTGGSYVLIVGNCCVDAYRNILIWDNSKYISIVGNACHRGTTGIYVSGSTETVYPDEIYIIANFTSSAGGNGIRVEHAKKVYAIGNYDVDSKYSQNFAGASTLIAKLNNRWMSEKSGTATFSGDGTTTQFSIAHGLVSTPTKVLVTPMTADAASDFYVTADDTNIYINYKSAPPSGTDNLKFSWYAEV